MSGREGKEGGIEMLREDFGAETGPESDGEGGEGEEKSVDDGERSSVPPPPLPEEKGAAVSVAESRGSDVVRMVGDTRVETMFEGDRETYPEPGQIVRLHCKGKLLDGTVFESTRERGHPLEFRVGIGQVIQGVDEGVLDMSKGERASLRVPPHEGYGAVGMPPRVPPNATLLWDLELIDVKPAPLRSLHTLRVVNEDD